MQNDQRFSSLLLLFQNRELQIMRRLDHQNIVQLKYFFFSSGDKVSSNKTIIHFFFYRVLLFYFDQLKEEVYLNLVLEFIPETVYRVARHYTKQKQTIPLLYVKVRLKRLLIFNFKRYLKFSCICINYFVHWLIYILLESVIVTLNRKICYQIRKHRY